MSHETPKYIMRFARAISPDYPELVLSRDGRGIPTLATQKISALEAEIDDLRINAERWERAWKRVMAELNDLHAKLAVAEGRVDKVRYSLSIMFDTVQELSPEDWKKWAHGYIEFMLVDLDEALAAIEEGGIDV